MKQKTLFNEDLTLDEAEELIKNGADVNEQDEYGKTPLFFVKIEHVNGCKLNIDQTKYILS
jgi:ankyrin repeat protein